ARQFGDPGVANTSHPDVGLNPCAEAGLDPVWIDPVTLVEEMGWSMCNLSSTVVDGDCGPEEFLRRCASAAFIGTMQACYTEVGYLQPVSKKILERDALLGVPIIGLAEAPHIMNPKVLSEGALMVKAVN